jgi:hypothetical protein
MMLKIGCFAEPSQLSTLLISNGDFATYTDVLVAARQTANDLQAYSFITGLAWRYW